MLPQALLLAAVTEKHYLGRLCVAGRARGEEEVLRNKGGFGVRNCATSPDYEWKVDAKVCKCCCCWCRACPRLRTPCFSLQPQGKELDTRLEVGGQGGPRKTQRSSANTHQALLLDFLPNLRPELLDAGLVALNFRLPFRSLLVRCQRGKCLHFQSHYLRNKVSRAIQFEFPTWSRKKAIE